MSFIRLLMLLLCITATSSLASDSQSRDTRDYFFILSFGDLPEELQLASDEGKLGMLLFFEADECPYCEHMIEHVFNQRSVQDWYGERFVSISIDLHGDVEVKDFDGISLSTKNFSKQSNVFVTPVLAFIDLNGQEIYRHVGMIKTAQEFLLLGEFVAGGRYRDMDYDRFRESRGHHNSDEALTTPGPTDD